jgi:hypothetical protein
MKNVIIYSFLLIIVLLFFSCKNQNKDLNIQINENKDSIFLEEYVIYKKMVL